jgi:transcriptional regulator with XRE-family HTH domain
MKNRIREIRKHKIFSADELTKLLGTPIKESRPLKQGEMAQLLEVGRSQLSKLENNKSGHPGTKFQEKLIALFGVTEVELFFGKEDVGDATIRLREENEQLRRMVKELSAML